MSTVKTESRDDVVRTNVESWLSVVVCYPAIPPPRGLTNEPQMRRVTQLHRVQLRDFGGLAWSN